MGGPGLEPPPQGRSSSAAVERLGEKTGEPASRRPAGPRAHSGQGHVVELVLTPGVPSFTGPACSDAALPGAQRGTESGHWAGLLCQDARPAELPLRPGGLCVLHADGPFSSPPSTVSSGASTWSLSVWADAGSAPETRLTRPEPTRPLPSLPASPRGRGAPLTPLPLAVVPALGSSPALGSQHLDFQTLCDQPENFPERPRQTVNARGAVLA